ncbi:Eco57I restriction-modification methylase domain-containing protein [Oricola sp.]|uniref:Eco57I restriction-modification methylase domain-containing protein n=1 Tax=Oricola sp. TaxID=1979950 RepID=UPI0035137D29
MARRTTDAATFPSLTVEGNLLSSGILGAIYGLEADEQTPDAYHVRRGLSLRDEFSLSFRVAQAHFDRFAPLESPGRKATSTFVRGLLTEAFAFDDLADVPLPLSMAAGNGRVPVVIIPPTDELDRASETLSQERRRSAAFALQDHLNDQEEALWGLVTNGRKLRLMRDNASLTRPAYIEADLAQIFETEDIASFATLWLLIHRSRFGIKGTPATDCALERWRDAGAQEGEAARDRLAVQVEEALRILGSGFLAENEDLRTRIETGDLKLTDFFNELLKLVYRLIFLMVAEDRNLLHPEDSDKDSREAYARGYSLVNLRQLALRRSAWDRHHDRFEGIKIVFSALAHGEKRLSLPALGGLFAEGQMPDIRASHLPNRSFLEALFQLGWLRQDGALVPVNWRAMETEELGSVYESLLELQPQIEPDGRTLVFATEAAEQKGNQRKTTGSYYTPDSLVQALLDTALDPVLDRTEAEADNPAEALLDLKVIDPACGSGHFLLAAARRIATRVARLRAEGTPSATDFRHALRDTARRCLHGVDRNPMAVELTKVALWIETVDPGLPLGFFDAQIRCGDALLGVFDLKVLEDGIPDAAYKPLTGDDKDVARHYAQKNKREREEKVKISEGFGFSRANDLMRDFAALRAMPEDTVEQIEAKGATLRALTAKGAGAWQLEMACDLYVSAFLLPKTRGEPHAGQDGLPRRGAEMVPTSGTLWEWLRGVQPFGPMFGAAVEAARNAHVFHWPLEFPDVMQRGGFDVVIGNPPWEVIQLSEKEFFATLAPEIAALSGAKRKAVIARLENSNPNLFRTYILGKREFDAANEFARASGRFPYSAEGKLNTYSLFAELFLSIMGSGGGSGLIVPTGIATDKFNAKFFAYVSSNNLVRSLFSFENEEFVFPSIHHSIRFCLLTLSRSNIDRAGFAFFLRRVSQLEDPTRVYNLSSEEIELINPITSTAPIFRTRDDADLTAAVYHRLPVLGDALKWKIWPVELIQNFFSTSNEADSQIIVRAEDMSAVAGFVPILRGTMIDQFNHGAATYDLATERFVEATPLDLPENWENVRSDKYVPFDALEKKLGDLDWQHGWLMGWRDITSAHVNRTVIASVFPRTATDDTLSLILPRGGATHAATLLANLNSLSLDYIARQKVGGTHIRKYVISQFPILPPDFYSAARLTFLTPRVLELTYTSHNLAPFARDLGHGGAPFAWDEDRRAFLRAELDAFYARAYGLTRDELRYILDPADVKGPDYPSETFRVLKEKEIRQYGEYRTRRLVLEALDRMEENGEFTAMGM